MSFSLLCPSLCDGVWETACDAARGIILFLVALLASRWSHVLSTATKPRCEFEHAFLDNSGTAETQATSSKHEGINRLSASFIFESYGLFGAAPGTWIDSYYATGFDENCEADVESDEDDVAAFGQILHNDAAVLGPCGQMGAAEDVESEPESPRNFTAHLLPPTRARALLGAAEPKSRDADLDPADLFESYGLFDAAPGTWTGAHVNCTDGSAQPSRLKPGRRNLAEASASLIFTTISKTSSSSASTLAGSDDESARTSDIFSSESDASE